MGKSTISPDIQTDVVLIGAGIMSLTLGTILKKYRNDMSVAIFERLDVVAGESSDAWNNAGTGHSALCELNYTPERADGSIDCSKAVKIYESFQVSRQFWAHLVEEGILQSPERFIRTVPHMSFVHGEKDVEYLRKRYQAMQEYPLFDGMQYSEDPEVIKSWIPLVMEGRDPDEKVAATFTEEGTDVNFGALTRDLLTYMQKQPGVSLHLGHEVYELHQDEEHKWILNIEDRRTKKRIKVKAKFVFIGAGGGALHLLEKSNIPEGRGFGGFPVSGQWLRCINPEIIEKHQAKVYGKAAVGAPPMSVPHLDTRVIDGEHALLFGPYAGFSTRFLKNGSLLDLPTSIKHDNIMPMIRAGLDNLKLTKYLIDQVRQSPDDRLNALKEYYPLARKEDWRLEIAGQRVQVIKKDPVHGGVLEFGTEVVTSADGSIAALLGASPGASTSVSIMLELIERCFPDRLTTPEVQEKLRETIPSYKKSLLKELDLLERVKHWTSEVLMLKEGKSSVI